MKMLDYNILPHPSLQLILKVLLLSLLLYSGLKAVFSQKKSISKTPKCKIPFSMDCRERESHARGSYPT